jgi:hypothetical protein
LLWIYTSFAHFQVLVLWSSWFIGLLPWSKSSIVISSFKSQQTWLRLILGLRIPLNSARVRIIDRRPSWLWWLTSANGIHKRWQIWFCD